MWWDHQNLNAPHLDRTGKRWNFRVWHGFIESRHVETVFFWDDDQEQTGMVLVTPGIHVKKLHELIKKLVAEPDRRAKYIRKIKFPLERHYSDDGGFFEN